jgi:flagellar hook-associated protein 3 FlgL
MRISTNTIYQSAATRLSDLQSSLVQKQQQIATGRRMLTPADDPVASARALEVTQAQSTNTQFATNRQNAKDSLNQEESALTSVTSILQDVRTLAVSAGNPTLNDTDRKSLATQLQGQFNQLLGLANSVDGTGNYLFSGYQTNTQPFWASATGATYAGDQGPRMLQVGPTQKLAMSDTGIDVFERNRTGNGQFSTSAVATNTGTGVISSGSVVVTNGYGTSTPATITNFNFGQAAVAQIDGTSDPKTVTTFDFSLAASAGAPATTVSGSAVTPADWSTSGTAAHFTFTDDTVTNLTVTLDTLDGTGGTAAITNAINAQLAAAGSNTVASINGSGNLQFTSGETGAASVSPHIVTQGAALDAAWGTAGSFVATPGQDTVYSGANFTVDGTPITLNGADTDINGVAAEITSKMQASALGPNYSASVVSGQIVITQAGSIAPVAITGADAGAIAAGITDSPGVAGSAAIPTTNATFSVDGTPITLNGNDTDVTGVAAELTSKMQASALGADYSASVVNGKLVITHAGTQAAVAITGADANAIAAGITDQPGVAGNVPPPISDQYRLDFSSSTPGTITYSIVDTTTSTTLSSGNPYTSGQAITFNGMQFNITGTPANGDQFTVQPSVNQSIFTTLKDLINVLNTPAGGSVGQTKLTNGLNTAQDDLGHALDNILTVRATVGSRLNSIDALDSNGSDKDLQYSTTLSQLQDLDYTKAITELTQQQTTLTAAQQSFVKISGLSLFNYL